MTRKVSNFSDLIQRITASCLLHPLADDKEECHSDSSQKQHEEEEDDEDEDEIEGYSEEKMAGLKVSGEERKLRGLMEEVFEAVSGMKRAYVRLQEAHCPWDPQNVRVADVAVVAQLKKLSVLRERFQKGRRRGGNNDLSLKEVVAPYEEVIKELKKEVKAKDLQVRNLKERLESVVTFSGSSGTENKPNRNQPHTKRKQTCISQIQEIAAPSSQLLEATMVQVKEASKSFTSLLYTLMKNAHWDITAAVRSIESAHNYYTSATATSTMVLPHHAKYALESYIFRKIFQGFDHETFYIDGSLSSLLNPHQFRRDSFNQFLNMKSMDPSALLGILPTCHFGKFCSNKYLSIVHPKMEESLFGNLEQQSQVSQGNHPRTKFYKEFLGVAKAMWLLHLVAFSLEPAPTLFEACRGAEFHPHYMDSVVKFVGGQVPPGQVVGFPISPGFKLGNGSILKARVYLTART